MKQRHVKCTVALVLLFATVFVIASCQVQNQFPETTTAFYSDSSTSEITTPERTEVASTMVLPWTQKLHKHNSMIVTFGALGNQSECFNSAKYVAISVTIDQYFASTLDRSFLWEKETWRKSTTLWIPEELAALPLEGTSALVAVKCVKKTNDQWTLAIGLEKYNDQAYALYFPIVDGRIQNVSSPFKVEKIDWVMGLEFLKSIEEGNRMIDQFGLTTSRFVDGISIREIQDFFFWTEDEYIRTKFSEYYNF